MTVVDARQLLVLITDPTEVQERREVPISFSDYDIVPKYIFLHLFSIQAVCDISGILNTGLDREVRISNSGTLTVHGVAEHFIFKRNCCLFPDTDLPFNLLILSFSFYCRHYQSA